MAGFWDLPAAEDLPDAQLGACLGTIRHTITHHHYTLDVVSAKVGGQGPGAGGRGNGYGWFTMQELTEIPLCTTAKKGLRLVEWNGSGKS
jgi:hypothetical protein